MAEDRYRLAPLRDVRTLAEKSRKGELASAVGDARETQAKLDAARARTQEARTALDVARTTRATATTGAQLARVDQFIARRRRELEQAIGEETRCEVAHAQRQGVVDAARLVLARARADREVIERHFAKWRDERKKLAERRDD